MHLANGSLWFILFIVFIAAVFTILFFNYKKAQILNAIFSKNQQNLLLSNFNRPARIVRLFCLSIGLFFILFALLDPRWGTKSVQANIEGIDVVFVLDISRSMTTPDIIPDRLSAAKKLSSQLMSLLLGNRIGITAFAGFAFNVIPLTTDINAASVFLNELSVNMIDIQGTNLEDALKKAMELFEKDTLTHKAIVVFTDGEDYEFSPMNQAKIAAEKGISIFTVGIGTPNGGEIPLYDEKGNLADHLKKNGETVISRLNDQLLAKIAEITKGFYIYGNENSIISLAKRLDEIKKSRFGNNAYEFMEPQYQYFLLIGLLLLFIYLLLPERRIKFNNNSFKGLIIIGLLLLPLFNKSYSSNASSGTDEYKKGNFEEALNNFQKAIVKDPKNEKYRFDEGDSFFQLRKYDESAASFFSLTNSKDINIRQKSQYNFGNSLLEKQDFTGAILAYKNILENNDKNSPIYKKALQNFVYAKQQLQQQNQNNSNQNKDDQKNDKNNKSDKEKQNQNNQNGKQNQEQKQNQTKPISPSDIDNILNLVQEDEKKHISRKERDKTIRVYPRDEW